MVYPLNQENVEEEMERIKEKREGSSKKILVGIAIGAIIAGVGGMILYDDMKLSTNTESSTPQYPDTPVVVATPTPTPTATPRPPHFVHKGKIYYYGDYPIPGTPESPEDVSEYVTTALEIGYEYRQKYEPVWRELNKYHEDYYEIERTRLIAHKWMDSAIRAVVYNGISEEYYFAYATARMEYLYRGCEDKIDRTRLRENTREFANYWPGAGKRAAATNEAIALLEYNAADYLGNAPGSACPKK